jgi:hypothetical protein
MSIRDMAKRVVQVRGAFEPGKYGMDKGDMDAFYSRNPVVQVEMDKVRTCLLRQVALGECGFVFNAAA